MRLILVGALAICLLATIAEAKPTFGYKVVPVPVLVPKINVLGLVGKVVGAKAALVKKVLGAKATLVGHLLGSSSLPTVGVVHPVVPEPIYPAAAPPVPPPPPPPPPSNSYGTPL